MSRPSTEMTWPTTPVGPSTVSPVSTPELDPTSRVTVWFHASVVRPMTRPDTPVIS